MAKGRKTIVGFPLLWSVEERFFTSGKVLLAGFHIAWELSDGCCPRQPLGTPLHLDHSGKGGKNKKVDFPGHGKVRGRQSKGGREAALEGTWNQGLCDNSRMGDLPRK